MAAARPIGPTPITTETIGQFKIDLILENLESELFGTKQMSINEILFARKKPELNGKRRRRRK